MLYQLIAKTWGAEGALTDLGEDLVKIVLRPSTQFGIFHRCMHVSDVGKHVGNLGSGVSRTPVLRSCTAVAPSLISLL